MTDRELLRHAVATLSYRAGKALRDAPEGFGDFDPGAGARRPAEILAHMGDLLDWALAHAKGTPAWHDTRPTSWGEQVGRFYRGLEALDEYLASDAPLGAPAGKLLQGPIADALHHVGQIALLRRLASAPVRGENYLVAEITPGRVGPEQAPPRKELD